MAKEFFPEVKKIQFEGKDSKNPMAFHYYDAEKVIMGKPMKEWLRFAMAWWHTLCAEGADQFGGGTKTFPWLTGANAVEIAKNKADAGFEIMEKLGIDYFCFHDRDIAPEAESLYDTEAGYTFRHGRLHLSLNAYWMHYRNQFVQTGALSDIGELLTTNIRSSYRLGLELAATYTLTPWLTLEANAAVSRNRIKDFTEHIEDWDAASGFTTQHYRRSTLAFSPTLTANAFADFHHKRWSATWHTAAVSRQYLDNTACKERSLAPYTFSDLRIGYKIPLRTRPNRSPNLSPSRLPTAPRRSEAVFSLTLSNLFNAHYSPTAWVYSAVSASSGFTPDHRYTQIGYFPTAGFTLIGSVTIKL